VNLWKGILKPLSAAGFIATFAGLIYHYVESAQTKRRMMMKRRTIMSKSKMILRTKFIDRACHWTVVISFFLVSLSGIALFFPTLQWLTETFGTPQMGRILHPFFGVMIFIVLMFMFVVLYITTFPINRTFPGLKGLLRYLKAMSIKSLMSGNTTPGRK
jgi:formate dehydrogenase-N gamma subunit